MANLDRQTYKSSWNPNTAEMVLKFSDNIGAGAAGDYEASIKVPAGSYITDVFRSSTDDECSPIHLIAAETFPCIINLTYSETSNLGPT